MIRYYIATIIVCMIPFFAFAQSFCKTPAPPQPTDRSFMPHKNSSTFYCFRLYFHILRATDGTGGVSVSTAQSAYNTLNDDFNSHNIFFIWNGTIDYIDNSSIYLSPSNDIFSINNHQNGIDVYIYPLNSTTEGLSNGFGNGTELYVSGYYNGSSLAATHVISHEMGHILNLYHTHHGTVFETGGDPNQCAELVNGSNADVCGDYVEDTPADPNISEEVNSSCIWTNPLNKYDSNHDQYTPNTHLIMSYTRPDCMEYFSLGQAVRMKESIESFQILDNMLLCYNISGNSVLYNSSEYSIANLPNTLSINWSLSGANASCYTVHNNTPSINQCTVTLKDSVDFVNTNDLVLNAQIKYGSTVITTVTKPLTPVYISGSTIPSSSEMYQIGNLPDNTVVSWNWTGKGLTIGSTPIMVEPYYSTNNYFNLLRSNMTYAKGIITANIMQGGNTIFVLTKTVDTGVNYSGGTWYQGNSSSNTLACGNAYDIVSNSQVVLQSNSFIGKTVSYSTDGFVLFGGLSHSGSNIAFTPISSIPHSLGDEPQAFGVKSVTINVTDPATYETFEFTFQEQLPFDDPLMMNVNSSGNEYTFTMEDIQKDRSQTWTLDVVNSETGRIAYHKKSNTTTQTINTTGWKKGVYIVKVTIGSQIISRKLTIP